MISRPKVERERRRVENTMRREDQGFASNLQERYIDHGVISVGHQIGLEGSNWEGRGQGNPGNGTFVLRLFLWAGEESEVGAFIINDVDGVIVCGGDGTGRAECGMWCGLV